MESCLKRELMDVAARFTDVGVSAGGEPVRAGVGDCEIAAAAVSDMYRAGSDNVYWGLWLQPDIGPAPFTGRSTVTGLVAVRPCFSKSREWRNAVCRRSCTPPSLESGLTELGRMICQHVFHNCFGYSAFIEHSPTWLESLDFFIRTDAEGSPEPGMVFLLPISVRKFGANGINLSHTIVIEANGAHSRRTCVSFDLRESPWIWGVPLSVQ